MAEHFNVVMIGGGAAQDGTTLDAKVAGAPVRHLPGSRQGYRVDAGTGRAADALAHPSQGLFAQ